MHELSICQALLNQVEALVRQHGARAARRVTVRVGALSGVVPELLARAFLLARAGTRACDAELIIEYAPVRVRCERCDAQSEASANNLRCAACGDWHTKLVSGDELVLVSVEMIKDKGPDVRNKAAANPCVSTLNPLT